MYGVAMKKIYLAGLFIVIISVAAGVAAYALLRSTSQAVATEMHYTCEVVNVYPHDTSAFTEGLVFNDGFLYEGTGLYGESKLQKIGLQAGNDTGNVNVIQSFSLNSSYFGEGITIFDNEIIQLTWLRHTGFVYEKDSFNSLANFTYPTEGWGITTDGEKLIMSDGTDTLYQLDPETFQVTGNLKVRDSSGPVSQLNELEYVNGDIYANVFEQKQIAIINITTGQVKAWINLDSLHDPNESINPNNVLNGIAYDSQMNRLFVTGKCWTQLFEIKLVPK